MLQVLASVTVPLLALAVLAASRGPRRMHLMAHDIFEDGAYE